MNSILKSLGHFWQHQLINTSPWRNVVDMIIFSNTDKLKQRENFWSAWFTYPIKEKTERKRRYHHQQFLQSSACSQSLTRSLTNWFGVTASHRHCTRHCTSLHSLQLSSNYFSWAKNIIIIILVKYFFFMFLLRLWFILKILATCITM